MAVGLLCRLGYVMTQALVEFGADAAIVDLNGLCPPLLEIGVN